MSDKPVVLVVDDRPENLLAVAGVLQQLDITIEKALRAESALHFLLENDVAAILLDVEMPGIDGFEMARLVRDRPRSHDTPIIFITAVERGSDAVREGYELGAVDYIVKPFQPDILRWKVMVLVELFRSRQKERLFIEERSRRIEIEATVRRARLLADVSRTLASVMRQDEVLERLASRFVASEFADYAVIFKQESQDAMRTAFAAGLVGVSASDSLIFARHRKDPLFQMKERSSWLYIADFAKYAGRNLIGLHEDLIVNRQVRSAVFIPLQIRGERIGAVGLYRRENRRLDSPERLLMDELTDRIALSLTNIQLYEQSERANRAKDEFLATVSHELRTPLVTILGWSHMLLDNKLAPERVDMALRTIQRSAQLQNELISDILDFSRFTSGRFSMKFEDVDVRDAVAQAAQAIRPLAEEKNIALVEHISDGAAFVKGDPNRLQQLFSNLLSNAIKFTPRDGQVTLRLESTDEHVRVEIKDTGIGIDPNVLPHVFEPFVQADSSNTRPYHGLGLGLAIVHRLVELHRGQIGVKSEGRGRGTTFTLTLPAGCVRSRAS
jgi:signal transduction histidine kinase/DNA-binding response OmpR family regulator